MTERTTRRSWRTGAALGIGVFMIAAAVSGVIAFRTTSTETEFLLQTSNLNQLLNGNDAVVVGSIVDVGDRPIIDGEGIGAFTFTFDVSEVLFIADQWSGVGHGLPPESMDLSVGHVAMYETYGEHAVSTSKARQAPLGTRLVVTLIYRSLDSNEPATWSAEQVAMLDDEGGLTFLGGKGEQKTRQLADVADEAGMTQVEALVGWVEEKSKAWTAGFAEPTGPVTDAFERVVADRRHSAENAAWHDRAPGNRYVDPEYAPAEVVATMSEGTVFIEVDASARVAGTFLVLVSDTGVVHRAALEAGSHPAPIFLTTQDEEITVYVEGGDEFPERFELGRFVPTRLGEGSTPVITLSATPTAEAPLSVAVTFLSDSSLRMKLDSWQRDLLD